MNKMKKTEGQVYKIKLAGHLDESWMDWFHGMDFSYEEDNTTIISGKIVDQSALHGILKKNPRPGFDIDRDQLRR